jgi:hypothetical protein
MSAERNDENIFPMSNREYHTYACLEPDCYFCDQYEETLEAPPSRFFRVLYSKEDPNPSSKEGAKSVTTYNGGLTNSKELAKLAKSLKWDVVDLEHDDFANDPDAPQKVLMDRGWDSNYMIQKGLRCSSGRKSSLEVHEWYMLTRAST